LPFLNLITKVFYRNGLYVNFIMGTSGSSYPSKICKQNERPKSLDDDIILSPSDFSPKLDEILNSRTQRGPMSREFIDNHELDRNLNNRSRFDFDNFDFTGQSKVMEGILKLGIYSQISTEYAKFRAIVAGIRFLTCLSENDDAFKCLTKTVARELINSQLDFVIENISEIATDTLLDYIEDDFVENGISPQDIAPIRTAFEYSLNKNIEKIGNKTVDQGVDISYEYLKDFLTDADVRCALKEATSNSKKYKSASLRYGFTQHDNGCFVPLSKLSNYRDQITSELKIRNEEKISKILSNNDKISDDNYDIMEYLEDVDNESIRNLNTELKSIDPTEINIEKIVEITSENEEETTREYADFSELFIENKIPTILEDILKISQNLMYFDINTKRNTKTTKDQKYILRINTPLADQWNNPAIKHKLQRVLYELMQENIIFEFLKTQKPVVPISDNFDSNKVVCLFSGGLDSYSGAIDLLKNDDLTTYFVSLRPRNKLENIQSELMSKLSDYFDKKLISLKYIIGFEQYNYVGPKDRYYHPTQRSRSLLYLSVALISAISNGARKIYIPENGVIALFDDVPFIDSESFTRTVHPDFIYAFNQLIQAVVDENVTVENPFAYKTKTEIINKIIENTNQDFAVETINMTESCSNQGNRWIKLNDRYCGICTPCILKSLALLASKIDVDKIDPPQINIFKMEFLSNPDDQLLDQKDIKIFRGELALRDLYYLAGKIEYLSQNDVLYEYPKLRNLKYHETFKKFATEVISIKLDPVEYPKFNELLEQIKS